MDNINGSSRILIDADFILFRVLPNKKQTPEEIEKYGDHSQRTFENICNGLDWFINDKILIPTNADEYIGFLGGYGNFRKEIAPTTYKANRIDMELPKWFSEAKDYLVDKWKLIKVDSMESEDAVGVCLTKYPDAIIVGVDHDLLQLSGTHYNPVNEAWSTFTEFEASTWFNKQQLAGCQTDKVVGLKKGVGFAKASKLLENICLADQPMQILSLFIEEYGEYDGIVNYAKNYQLLKILREKEGFEIPEFIKVNKEEEIKIDF